MSIRSKWKGLPVKIAEWFEVLNARNYYTAAPMLTSSNGNVLRVTGHLCGEFTCHRWIPLTKASDVTLWCFQPHDCLLNRLFGRRTTRTSNSASLAFVRGIHRWPVKSPHKGPVTRKASVWWRHHGFILEAITHKRFLVGVWSKKAIYYQKHLLNGNPLLFKCQQVIMCLFLRQVNTGVYLRLKG